MTLHALAAIPDSFMHASPKSSSREMVVPPHVKVSKAEAVHRVLQQIILECGFSFAMGHEEWAEYLLDEIFCNHELSQKLLICILGNYPEEFSALQETVDEIIYDKAKSQLAKMSFEDLKNEGLA